MPAPKNAFKQALREGRPQIGCWVGLADASTAEIMTTAGFDWLLIDGEHAPNDIRSLRDQLQVVGPSESHPVVRLPIGEAWLIKQVLDVGAQTLLIPMIDTADQAREMVRACRYPPEGLRGVGSALARASRFAGIPDYLHTANDEICLLLQVETVEALANLDAILAVDNVDGLFVGPSDLAASMGHMGNPGHPEVQEAVQDALVRIAAAGKAPGILTADLALARRYLELGALFVATGIDVTLLAQTARNLATKSKALIGPSAGPA